MRREFGKPEEIETESMRMISEILGNKADSFIYPDIVKRVIHTTADFDYAENLYFSEQAVEKMMIALKNGVSIVTDTKMAQAGINKLALAKFGGQVHCFMADEDVAAIAKARGVTRALVSMAKAAELKEPFIFAIGNAPTALFAIKDLCLAGKLSPVGVIAVPVGFVNVVEAKEEIIAAGIPAIVAQGRKGGSNVAAAICNALLYRI